MVKAILGYMYNKPVQRGLLPGNLSETTQMTDVSFPPSLPSALY